MPAKVSFPSVALAVLMLGCAAVGGRLSPEHEAGLESVRALVEGTRSLYGLPPIYILTGDHIAGVAASYRTGQLGINPRVLVHSHRDALISHELAHAVLGHDRGHRGFDQPATVGEWAGRQVQRELDANAKAVEILRRVKGWPELTALTHVSDWLVGQHSAEQSGRKLPTLGHARPCTELADLWARFHQHVRPAAVPSC